MLIGCDKYDFSLAIVRKNNYSRFSTPHWTSIKDLKTIQMLGPRYYLINCTRKNIPKTNEILQT